MPEVAENMTREHLKFVRKHAILAARYWLDMYVAAGNGDVDGCKGIYKFVRDETVLVSDKLKAIIEEGKGGGK